MQAFPSSRPFFEALAQAGTSVVSNADNLLDPASSAPWALVRTTQANGWWVVAQVSASEAMASQTPITIAVWGLLGLALLLLGGGLALLWWLLLATLTPLTSAASAATSAFSLRAYRSNGAVENSPPRSRGTRSSSLPIRVTRLRP